MMEDTNGMDILMDGKNSIDPLSDPLAGDDMDDEYQDKDSSYDSPCVISDVITLVDDAGVDEECGQVEKTSDPFGYQNMNKQSNSMNELMDVTPVATPPVRSKAKRGPYGKRKMHNNGSRKKMNLSLFDMGSIGDLDDDFDLMFNSSCFGDELDEFGFTGSKRMDQFEMIKRMRELESHYAQCKVNIKVMQSRLDEERGKMLRIRNYMVNLKRYQERAEMAQKMKPPKLGTKIKQKRVRSYEEIMASKMKMARLRELKAKKALEKKPVTDGIEYQKELENKLRMAELREIKFKKALERKLTEGSSPDIALQPKPKPMITPKTEVVDKSEDYAKVLESKLKAARDRELQAKEALDNLTNGSNDKIPEESIPTTPVTPINPVFKKKLKIKMNLAKKTIQKKDTSATLDTLDLSDEQKAREVKTKMAKLREIKAQKAIERKRLEDLGLVPPRERKYQKKEKKEPEVYIKQEPVDISLIDDESMENEKSPEKNESKNKKNKPDLNIATSHMLWNVLSRMKMDPDGIDSQDAADESNSLPENSNTPAPSEIPKLVKDFMHRSDVSKISTNSPNSITGDPSGIRYRMHYLPILHKQFEAENGSICSYASFCNYIPENIKKPKGWQWRFCPCLPCINPELKFEKMVSEGILKMEGIELGDILHDDERENLLMTQLRDLKDSKHFFTYDTWERNSSGTINSKRRTASEPVSLVVTKLLEELSVLKSHFQRTFYQYHCAKLARDRGIQCSDEVTLHIECSPLTIYQNGTLDAGAGASEPAAQYTILTSYLWSQNFEQAIVAISDNRDYSTSGIWAALEKILLSFVKAGKKKINIISDNPTNKYRNKSNFYYMTDFAQKYTVCFRWIFLELCHQIGNANTIREDIERVIKIQLQSDPEVCMIKSELQQLLQSELKIIVDSYTNDDVQKYKWNLPKLRAVQGTQKFDEVIVMPDDFWVRDVIGFDTFKKLPFGVIQ